MTVETAPRGRDTSARLTPRLVRSRRSWATLLVAVVVSLSVVVFGRPDYAAAFDTPKPVLNPFGSAATDSGAAGLGTKMCTATAATGFGCVALAGVGAYEGTCWVLGVVVPGDKTCPDSWMPGGGNVVGTVLHYVFGIGGDDRSSGQAAGKLTSATVGGTLQVSYTGTTNSWLVFHYGQLPVDGSASMQSNSCEIQLQRSSVSSGSTVTVAPPLTTPTGTFTQMGIAVGGTSAWSSNSVVDGNCSGTGSGPYKLTAVYQGGASRWTAVGNIMYPDPGAGTPWTLKASEDCVLPNGTKQTVTQTAQIQPQASGVSPGIPLPACSDVLPGSHQANVSLTGGRTGYTVANPDVNVVIGDSDATKASYPLCTTKAPAGGCWLDLQRNGKSCFGGAYCAGWLANEQNWNMSCIWGPYTLSVTVCEQQYGTSFDLQDQPRPSDSANPQPSAGAIPSTGTNPSMVPQPSITATPPTVTIPDPTPNPESTNCWGDGWSWNPVSWVYVPVKCAFIWAFVPQTSLATMLQGVGDAYANKIPVAWLHPLLTIPTGGPGNNGCPDWNITVGSYSHTIVCDSDFTARIVNARPWLGAAMIVLAAWPLIRGLMYAAVPLLKPVPTDPR